jgi:hypothetical protein
MPQCVQKLFKHIEGKVGSEGGGEGGGNDDDE